MKTRSITLLGCALAACLTGNSCRKSDDAPKCQAIPDGPGCQPIPVIQGPTIGYDLITEGRYLRTASFNPNNNDEFAFWIYGSQHIDTLFVYNTSTGQMRKILEAGMWYPPQWGSNGWILLGLAGGNLAMIKPNGDSLTDISQGRDSYHHPAWNASCTRICAYTLDGPDVLLTLNGTVTDSFHFGGSGVDFIDDDRFVAGVGVFTISTRQYDRIIDPTPLTFTGSGMISADEFIWSDIAGIYKTSILSRQTITLKTSCNSRVYFNPSVNASKTKVLWTRITSRADTCSGRPKLYEDFEIVEMNVDGTGEREIPIPE